MVNSMLCSAFSRIMTSNSGDFWKRGTTGTVPGLDVPEFPQGSLGLPEAGSPTEDCVRSSVRGPGGFFRPGRDQSGNFFCPHRIRRNSVWCPGNFPARKRTPWTGWAGLVEMAHPHHSRPLASGRGRVCCGWADHWPDEPVIKCRNRCGYPSCCSFTFMPRTELL
jgi:hypothetical protein